MHDDRSAPPPHSWQREKQSDQDDDQEQIGDIELVGRGERGGCRWVWQRSEGCRAVVEAERSSSRSVHGEKSESRRGEGEAGGTMGTGVVYGVEWRRGRGDGWGRSFERSEVGRLLM